MEHFLLSSFCFLLFIFILHRNSKKSKANGTKSSKVAPGPRKLPIIGNILQLIGSLPHHRLRDLANRYGPVMHLQVGEVSTIVISSREAAKEVLRIHDTNFAQRPCDLAADIIMYNFQGIVFGPYNDRWKQLRKICNLELFSTKRVRSFRSIREDETLLLITSISSSAGSIINLTEMIFTVSNCITLRTAFGKVCRNHNEFVPVIQKILRALEGFSASNMFPSIKILHQITGNKTYLKQLHQEVDKILENIINEHKEKKVCNDSEVEESDLVDFLLNLQDHGNLEFPLTTDNIKAVMLDMFVAGSETSATVVEWAMSEMIKDPKVMEKAQAEVRKVCNEKHHLNETILVELKYLKLVIKETLRLHPPGPLLIPRECIKDMEVNGYVIPAKTRILVNAWAIARDPHYWEEAEKFYPERFLDNSIDYRGNDFEFLPFGSGRRICPGMSFGIAVVEITLASLLYHFDWKLAGGMEPNDLDMSEGSGLSAPRKNDLCLIPTLYHPSPVEKF